MSHTPGPWMVEMPNSYGTRVRNELLSVAWCGCAATVGIKGSHRIDADEAAANARLIAAAPDLLTELVFWLPVIRAHVGASHMMEGFNPKKNSLDDRYESTVSVIAKARGET